MKKIDKINRVSESFKILSEHLDTEYNLVLKNGKKYLIKDLAKDMHISEPTAQAYFKELLLSDDIRLVKTERYGEAYAINPSKYAVGNVSPKIIEFFNRQSQKQF